MWFAQITDGPFSGRSQPSDGLWPVCLALILTLIACIQPTTYDHVALEGKPESLEQKAPTWVKDFALAVSDDIAADGPFNGLQPNRRPHVLLISLDTLRADHLGAWVHEGHHRSIRDGSRMLYDHGTGKIELFSVVEDPFEHVDIFPTQPDLAVETHQRLLEFITTHGLLLRDSQEEARELSSEEIEALRALGYIE